MAWLTQGGQEWKRTAPRQQLEGKGMDKEPVHWEPAGVRPPRGRQPACVVTQGGGQESTLESHCSLCQASTSDLQGAERTN